MNLSEFSVVELREMLRRCSVKTGGNKNELILRLQELDDDLVAKVIEELQSEWNAKKSAVEENDVDEALKVSTQVAELQKVVEQLKAKVPLVTEPTSVFSPQLGLPLTSQSNSVLLPTHVSHPNTIGHHATQPNALIPPYISQSNPITHYAAQHHATEAAHFTQPYGMNPSFHPQVARPNMNVSEIVAILPKYDPLKEEITAEQFIARIEQLRGFYCWDDRLLLFATQVNLLGVGKTWVDGYPNVFLNWTHFVQEFRKQFPTVVNIADIHMQLMKMHRGTDEDVEAYYYRMVATARRGGIDEKSMVKYIITGLNDNDMKRSISVCDYNSIYELLVAIKNYKKYNSLNKAVKPNFVKQTTTMSQKEVSKSSRSASNLVCYNCRRVGHLSRDCSEPQKRERCTKCNKFGHAAAHCPIKNEASCNQINSSTGSIYKLITVDDIQTKALVDSGSARSLVRESFAKSLGPHSECNIVLRGFGGGQYECQRKVLADLRMDEVSCRNELLVVPDEMLGCEVLLGGDVLCSQGNILLISGDQCMIKKIEEPNVTSFAENELQELLKKYSSRFSTNAMTVGKCNVVKMKIQLSSSIPINLKPYRPPFARRQIMRQQIDDLLQSGIIRLSSSPYASPALLVPKKGGEFRLCVDFRQLNSVTKKQPYPMPIMEELFFKLSGNSFFTTLDLNMGYHQIELDEESKPLTGFVTTEGHYEYNRVPFGLVNAPAVFQEMVDKILASLPSNTAVAYLDDIVIPSRTMEEGVTKLNSVLSAMESARLTLRKDKCRFLASEINFLGHVISEAGVVPGQGKTLAITNFKQPTNSTEVRRFLGLTGFFRKFVENYSFITRPLTNLIKKEAETTFKWNNEQQQAFEKLKIILTNPPILVLYSFSALHEVHTDASSIGVAAVLLQSTDNKNLHSVTAMNWN